LKPFRFGQWVRLAFVGLLAGEIGSGGGCNSGGFHMPATHHPRGGPQTIHTAFATPVFPHTAISIGLIVFLVLAGLVLLVALMYVSSVMRFVLFESIVARVCHIREGWARHRQHGFQLFVWQISFALFTLCLFAALIGVPLAGAWMLGWITHPRGHLLPMVLGGIFVFGSFFILILGIAIVHVMTKDFVVPQMALENIDAFEAWRRLWILLKSEKAGYAGYIGMKIVLAIGFGMVLGIITFMVVFAMIIPIGGVGIVAILSGKLAGLTWNFYTIALAAAAGFICLTLFMFVAALISVPAIVFFPAYSIYFFAPRYPLLAALLTPQIPPSGSTLVPSGSPPLPPTPAPFG
jgi:hypothetical protein